MIAAIVLMTMALVLVAVMLGIIGIGCEIQNWLYRRSKK